MKDFVRYDDIVYEKPILKIRQKDGTYIEINVAAGGAELEFATIPDIEAIFDDDKRVIIGVL